MGTRFDTPRPREREAGFSLAEVTVAASIFALALMSTGLTLLHGVRSQAESERASGSVRAVRDVYAEIQQIANLPQDLSNFRGIGAVYTLYNNMVRPVPELPQGTITITVFANEATVPIELGGPQDMNFDADAQDDLGGLAAGTDLQIAPIRLTLSYTDDRGTITQTHYRRITQTTD
jgi:type II secretory pathway pseudopilin PulG